MVMIGLMIEQIYIFFRRNRESPEYIFSKVFYCAGFAGMKICFGWDETEFLPYPFFWRKEAGMLCGVRKTLYIFAEKKDKVS